MVLASLPRVGPEWNPTSVFCFLMEEGWKLCPQEPLAVSCVLSSPREGVSLVQFNCVHQSTLLGKPRQGHKRCHSFLSINVLFEMLECGLRPSNFLLQSQSLFKSLPPWGSF